MRVPPQDSEQCWPRYSNYSFMPFSELLKKLPAEMLTQNFRKNTDQYLNEIVIMPADDALIDSYKIFDTPNLYASFAKQWDADGRFDPAMLRHWIEAYGLPIVSMAGSIDNTTKTLSPIQSKLSDRGLTNAAEIMKHRLGVEAQIILAIDRDMIFLPTMALLAADLSYCIKLYVALKEQNDRQVLAFLHGYGTVENLEAWIQKCGKNPYDDIPRETTYRTAWDSFLMHLAGQVDRIAPRPIKVHPNDPFSVELKPEYRVPDLIAAMWLQFYKAITGDGVEYKTCKYCEQLFHVTHTRQEFCPDKDYTGHSICKRAWDRKQVENKKRQIR